MLALTPALRPTHHPACQAANLGRRQLAALKGPQDSGALKGAECLGADTLLQLLKNYARRWALAAVAALGREGGV